MSTLTEVLLVIVVTTLTITLTIIGIQLFLMLRDLRERVLKLDPILDNVVLEQEHLNKILASAEQTTNQLASTTDYVTNEVVRPLGNVISAVKGFSQLIDGFRGRSASSAHSMKKRYLRDKAEDYEDEDFDERRP